MIANYTKGKDFYGVLAYHEKKVEQEQGYVIDSNIAYGTTVSMTKEFNMIRQLRSGLSKAVFHVSLSLPYSDELSDVDFTSLGCDYLKGMGFTDNLVANRVQFSGEVVSDSNDYGRSKLLVRELEKKYGLTQLPNSKFKKKTALTQQEIEKALRTGNVPVKLILQQKIDKVILNSSDVSQFINKLKLNNISPKFNASKTTGRVTGISFKYEGIIYKGSSLGRKYSWGNITKQIDYEQDRDRTIIFQTNFSERGTNGINTENSNPAIGSFGETKRSKNGAREIDSKSKRYLGKTQINSLNGVNNEDNLWMPFKLELKDDNKRKTKKKRKGKRL